MDDRQPGLDVAGELRVCCFRSKPGGGSPRFEEFVSSWGLSSGLLSHAEATQARVRRDTETLTLRVSAICEMCITPDREGHAAGLIALNQQICIKKGDVGWQWVTPKRRGDAKP